MPRVGLLFPGQGAQFVGMGAELFDARPDLLIETADAVLGWSLRDVCLEGPEERLTATEHAQPALYALSYVLWEALQPTLDGVEVSAAAGHSLGEYTALAAAGVLGFEDGLRLVAERGQAMADAAALEPSGMAALIGADESMAEAICAARRAEGGRLWVANLNAPGQVVVAGGTEDLAWAAEHVRDHGIRRAIPLKVAGAFHTPFMAPAAERLAGAVGSVSFGQPAFPVFANTSATPHDDEVAAGLVAQLTGQVRFEASVRAIAGKIDALIHVGPGDVTAGMAKRISPDTPIHVANELGVLAHVRAALEEQESA
ncbi:MAG: ACP S-malonyltransferase [Acidimicrobiia bacterium]|nr:ACP S-malonyltransferase [Acidimicrobiia bacterium]